MSNQNIGREDAPPGLDKDADDLAAQTFMRIIEALPRYQHCGQFTAWVFQIAHSKAMDFFRHTHSRVGKEADANGVLSDQALESIIQRRR